MQRPVVGLALGAGAAKGYAHIGVLKVLKRESIPIDVVTGSSIGALIGSLYAAGIDVDIIETLAYQIRRRHWLDLTLPAEGLIAGKKIESILSTLTKGMNFEQLRIPLGVVVTNLSEKKSVLVTSGSVAKAVRASISIPGIFEPVIKSGQLLVDGGVLERVPGKEARLMGSEFVIGVELGFGTASKRTNIYDILMRTFDIMGEELQNLKGYNTEVLITPKLEGIDSMAFNQVKKCIAAGEKAAEQALPDILHGIKKEG